MKDAKSKLNLGDSGHMSLSLHLPIFHAHFLWNFVLTITVMNDIEFRYRISNVAFMAPIYNPNCHYLPLTNPSISLQIPFSLQHSFQMNSFKVFSTLVSLVLGQLMFTSVGVSGTTFTFVNKCDQTVWPGLLAGAGSPKLDTTGFELPQGGTQTLQAPTGWSGRFWGRTGCNFDSSGAGSCMTADCGSGQVECNGAGAVPPATLAEFTLNGSGGQDFYDVSLVDGYNLPMIVESTGGSGGCQTTGCLVDLNRRCPTELQSEGGGACRSACEAFGNPEYCCSGEYRTPATCKPTAYSRLFKSTCPRAYSYAYDDASSTFTCSGGDYVITFCPSTPSQKSSTNPSPVGVGANLGTDSASGAAGSGDSPFSASWLANLAAGRSSNASHPSIALQFALLLVVITALVTSFHN